LIESPYGLNASRPERKRSWLLAHQPIVGRTYTPIFCRKIEFALLRDLQPLRGEKAQERNHMTIHSQSDIEECQHFLNVVA
jgi:hypothetical protein